MNRVSVIIACYNSGASLESAILSVLNQSLVPVQLIIKDNHSTDPITKDILNRYQDQITWINQPDTGIYDAFNQALEMANGEWVYFMGADDQLATESVLEQLLKYAFVPKYKIITGDIINQNIQSHWVPQRFHSEFGNKLYWKNTVHQQGCLYHRDCFETFRFNPQWRVLGDYQLHLNLYKADLKRLETSLVICVCDADGISKKFNSQLYAEEWKMKKETLSGIVLGLNYPWIQLKKWLKASND